MEAILSELIQLSHDLGREDRDLVILGEGNTSAAVGEGQFWVKASGSHLETIDESGFSLVDQEAIRSLCDKPHLSDDEVALGLAGALVHKAHRRPSVETFLHGLCYLEAGVRWVGHTHPVAVNAILCSRSGASPFLSHLFPDGIVVCGVVPAVLPYIDPGFQLALAFREELRRYLDRYGRPPKVLLMENHGLVAMGQSAAEVLAITLMADKWARVILGAYSLGGPHFLSDEATRRINDRQDENYRRKQLGAA